MRGENPFAPRSLGGFERLHERVWLWRNIVNSTVLIGADAVAVVDTQVNAAAARRLAEAIRTEIGKPVRFTINTHYHWDHTSGNAVFGAQGAHHIASARTARAMVERSQRQKDFLASRGFELGADPVVPGDTFMGSRTLDLGGLTLVLSEGHAAETADPTLAWCPEAKVLIAGDTVMTGSFPIFGQPSQREGLEDPAWIDALAEVRAFGAAVVAPGHGPAAREPELALFERIMRYFLEQVGAHRRAGRTLEETIALMEDEMPAWISRIPQVWGTPRYAILRVWAGLADLGQPGWQHVKPSALPAADAPALTADWAQAVDELIEGGDAARAVALSEAVAKAHPDDPAAWTGLARALVSASRSIASVLEKGDCFQRAKDALARARGIDPRYGPALLQAGQFHVMMAFRNGEDPIRGEQLLDEASLWQGLSARQRAELAFYRGIAARARGAEGIAHQRFGEALGCDPTFMPARLAAMA